MLDKCRLFADIGADHGRLSAIALMQRKAERALVTDISDKALQKARTLITRLGLKERVIFSVSDGLDALKALNGENADAVFILGMGGETVGGILRRGYERLCGSTLIMSVHTDIPALRAAVVDIGYRIREERIAHDSGRDYVLMKCMPALPNEPAYTEEELMMGAELMRSLPSAWKPLLDRRLRLLTQGIAAMEQAGLQKDAERLGLFKREYDYVTSALRRLEEKNRHEG